VITSEFHVEINGVKYRLAEDGEGEHYVLDRQTLRAPNTQIVQGADSALINVNPETLVWSWDAWDGGEAQLKFTPEGKNRAQVIEGLNFYGRPGDIFLGFEPNLTTDSGAATFTDEVGLVVGRAGTLFAIAIGATSPAYYTWDGPLDWSASSATGSTDGARSALAIAGDNNYTFFVRHNTDEVWRYDGSWALHNDQTGGDVACQLASWGDYLYKYDQDGKVYELSKVTANTATAETAILDVSSEGTDRFFARRHIVAGDRRVYVMRTYKTSTVIYEIIPSSAAQTGYGRELLRMEGVRGESMWFHGGFLYWTGVDDEPDATVGYRRVMYYLQPDASYGAVGELRSFDFDQRVAGGLWMTGASRNNTFAIVGLATLKGKNPATAEIDLFEVDAISGGFGVVGLGATLSLGEHFEPTSLVFHEGKYFASIRDKATGNTHRVMFWDTMEYNTSGYTISPAHDFGLASTKVLQSIEVVCEPLPTNASIQLAYSLDGGSFTSLSAYTTDSGTGESVVISTDAAPKTFRSMRVKLTLNGDADETPIVKAVNVRASSNETYKVWQLLVDCTDEGSPRGYSGEDLIDNLVGLNNDTVVAFKDGYTVRRPGEYDEHDVIVQNVILNLTKPGEGLARVTLREVT
jgi:hypothetical protein